MNAKFTLLAISFGALVVVFGVGHRQTLEAAIGTLSDKMVAQNADIYATATPAPVLPPAPPAVCYPKHYKLLVNVDACMITRFQNQGWDVDSYGSVISQNGRDTDCITSVQNEFDWVVMTIASASHNCVSRIP